MSDYRRWYQPGGTYFFTVVTYNRIPLFKNPAACRLLGNIIREIKTERPFTPIATVLLDDHLHTVWALPEGDSDFPTRWKLIKRRFTMNWLQDGNPEAPVTPGQDKRGSRGVWQKRFWEHLVRDENDLEAHCDYIHYNPVKHGYVKSPNQWRHSTFQKFVKLGQYSPDWGADVPIGLVNMDLD